MGSTRKKVSIKNKSTGHHYKQQNRGYSFKTWLEYARECTLRTILIVEIPFSESVQSDVKQEEGCDTMPLIEKIEHKEPSK